MSCGSGLKTGGRTCLLSGGGPVRVLTCHAVPGRGLVGAPVCFQASSLDFRPAIFFLAGCRLVNSPQYCVSPWSAVQRSGVNVVFQPEYFAEAGRRPRLWGLTCHVVPV